MAKKAVKKKSAGRAAASSRASAPAKARVSARAGAPAKARAAAGADSSARAARAVDPAEKRRMGVILSILKREYPDSRCSLYYETPFQLLVATVLSAQCTDERVNQVTPVLFSRFPGPREMAAAKLSEIEKIIQSTGFFRSKAKSLSEIAQVLVRDHGGEVPRDLDSLVRLRGVGRKTANVVLGNAYGVPGLVVDTHVGRLCRRMGFTRSLDPEKVEQEMMELVPREDWTLFSHLLIDHGRAICTARRAYCEKCPIAKYCPKVGVV